MLTVKLRSSVLQTAMQLSSLHFTFGYLESLKIQVDREVVLFIFRYGYKGQRSRLTVVSCVLIYFNNNLQPLQTGVEEWKRKGHRRKGQNLQNTISKFEKRRTQHERPSKCEPPLRMHYCRFQNTAYLNLSPTMHRDTHTHIHTHAYFRVGDFGDVRVKVVGEARSSSRESDPSDEQDQQHQVWKCGCEIHHLKRYMHTYSLHTVCERLDTTSQFLRENKVTWQLLIIICWILLTVKQKCKMWHTFGHPCSQY